MIVIIILCQLQWNQKQMLLMRFPLLKNIQVHLMCISAAMMDLIGAKIPQYGLATPLSSTANFTYTMQTA